MFNLANLDARRIEHEARITRIERRAITERGGRLVVVDCRAWQTLERSPRLVSAASKRTALVSIVWRRAALALVRIGARLLGVQHGTLLGTGRIVRGSGSEILGDGLDHPVWMGVGPDGALYLTYPAADPGSSGRQGPLLRIDVSMLRSRSKHRLD